MNYLSLISQIRLYRELITKAIERYGITSPQVIWMSQRLDRIILKYYFDLSYQKSRKGRRLI